MESVASSKSLLDQLLALLVHSNVLSFQQTLPFHSVPKQILKLFRQTSRFFWQIVLDDDESDFSRTPASADQQVPADLASRHLTALEAILDWLYEQMNSCRYDRVPLFIRQLYALASLYHCCLRVMIGRKQTDSLSESELRSALRTLDMGLLYCPPLCHNLLARTATLLHDHLISVRGPFQLEGLQRCDPTVAHNSNLQTVARLLSSEPDRQVACVDGRQLDMLTFQRNHLIPRRPVRIRNAITDWPAMQKWNLQYVLDRCGARLIPVEIGQKYTDTDWGQKVMTFVEFVDQFIVGPKLNQADNDRCLLKGYCAQYELFDRVECLANDFYTPDYCGVLREPVTRCDGYVDGDDDDDGEGGGAEDRFAKETVDINAWFGPEATVSPLHHDAKDNIFAQVLGRKYVRLYSSQLPREQMYVCDSDLLDNTSEVDVENVDRQRFPHFPTQYVECVVQPGDLLYIPKRDWHYVRSLDVSFSISFWWNGDDDGSGGGGRAGAGGGDEGVAQTK